MTRLASKRDAKGITRQAVRLGLAAVLGGAIVLRAGAVLANGGQTLPPEPIFSVASGIFTNNAITFTISAAAGTIRYSLNGDVPTESSPVYTGPITVNTNVFIKARTFQPGLSPSPVVSRVYHFLDASARDFHSNLPILVLNTSGRAIPDNVPPGQLRVPGSFVVIDVVNGRSSLQNNPEFIGLAEFEVFGQTSAGFPKVPLTIEIQDELRNDRRVSLLGMPAEADWRLRSLYNDKSFLNEVLAFELFEQMGRYAVRRRFVEVFVDRGGGRISYPQDYNGVMVLMERIERGAHRVPISKLTPWDAAEPEITGGYMWKKDKDSVGDLNFLTAGGGGFAAQALKIHEPKPREITTNQLNWLRNYLNQFERALYAPDWLGATGTNHYSHYIDVDSFVDQHWIVEFTKNIDGYRLSNFMSKDRGGKINMGPIWGWDRSFGNADYLEGARTNGWYWNLQSLGLVNVEHIWLRRLLYGNPTISSASPVLGTGDPDFIQKTIDRWGVLRTNVFAPAKVLARVDELSAMLSEAAARDFAKYPRLGMYVWPNPSGPPLSDVDFVRPTTYPGIISELKKWIQGRYSWIDRQFVQAPFFHHPGGQIPAGFQLTMSAPAGTIYYTLDGSDPRAPGGGVMPGAQTFDGPIAIDANVRVFARTRNGTNAYAWSPPSVATFYVSFPGLRITEIMYHPLPASPDGTNGVDFEYIELKNIGPDTLNPGGCRIRGGIEFTFPAMNLAAGQRIVVVKNQAAFNSRYPDLAASVAGQYTGDLADNGDRLVLEGPSQEPILDFEYDATWYPITDGFGFSLVVVNDTAPVGTWGLAAGWRPSGAFNGTPGLSGGAPPTFPQVVINEALTHSDPPESTDTIELLNLSAGPADIAGWYLTDDFHDPKKYRIPIDTPAIPANGYRIFDESAFHPGDTGLSLSSTGGEVYLFSAGPNGDLTGYFHGFKFGPQRRGITFGRHVTSDGEEQFVAQAGSTLGAPNAEPLIGPVVISEIMYQPPKSIANGAFSDDVEGEYIELFNRSDTPVNLFDPNHPENSWKLGQAVEFEFPPTTTIVPGGFVLVVSFDPVQQPGPLNAFRMRYHVPEGTPILGSYRGYLSNDHATVALFTPAEPVATGPEAGSVPYVLSEQVQYSNRPPWPAAADGIGFSLQRREQIQYANDPVNWAGSSPTPGGLFTPGWPPTIITQPQSQTAITPHRAAFAVGVGGPGPFRFQWRYNDANIPGATNPVLVLDPVKLSDAGQYQVVVLNGASFTASTVATLSVLAGVAINEQPRSQTVLAGTNVTFTVVASSSSAIRYQWRFNGTNLPGATNAVLSITGVTNIHDGVYSVVCTDSLGSLVSQPAELIVLLPPLLVAPVPPIQLTAVAGESLTLGVQLQGTLPIYCRWRLFRPGSGQILSEQVLTQRQSYITVPVTAASAGAYTVILTNQIGGFLYVPRTNAILTVLTDTDGDLIPDAYEEAHELRSNDPSDGQADADGDGVSNRGEYVAGTDPQDPGSYLKVNSIAVDGVVNLQFGAVSNRTYSIQYTDSLAPGFQNWRKLVDVTARETNRMEIVFDPTFTTNRYYRVATPRQP